MTCLTTLMRSPHRINAGTDATPSDEAPVTRQSCNFHMADSPVSRLWTSSRPKEGTPSARSSRCLAQDPGGGPEVEEFALAGGRLKR